MKIKPEILLSYNAEFIFYKKFLISGSDDLLINYVKDYIVANFKKKNFYIDLSGSYDDKKSGDLFSDKKVLFLLKDKNEDVWNSEDQGREDQSFLIVSPNSKNNNKIKSIFLKSKDCVVIDCYNLNRASKEVTLKGFIRNKNIKISNEVFWYILDNFDNNYVLFIKQLETLRLLDKNIDSLVDVEGVISGQNKIELNKIFFNVFKNNNFLIKIFNKNINTQSDYYIFINSLKNYMEIISQSKNMEDVIRRFPKYLFNEKEIFLSIYNKINKKKLLNIYKNISKADFLVRKYPSLCFVIGLRLLLNTKKIITS